MIKNLGFIAAGALLTATIPSIASTTSESVSLTPGQIEFIRQFDYAAKTNFSNLANNPAAVGMIKSATIACGNIDLQKQTVYAAGGTESQANYASNKFETLFCR